MGGGNDHDEAEGNQRVFQKERTDRDGSDFAVLHFLNRPIQKPTLQSCVATNTLQLAFWPPLDMSLYYTGPSLLRWEYCTVCL